MRRALPIFRGEGVQSEIGEAYFSTRLDDVPNRFFAAPVAFKTAQAAPLGPAAVPVHDNGDMTGQPVFLNKNAHALESKVRVDLSLR